MYTEDAHSERRDDADKNVEQCIKIGEAMCCQQGYEQQQVLDPLGELGGRGQYWRSRAAYRRIVG